MDKNPQNLSRTEASAKAEILALLKKSLGKGFRSGLVEISQPPEEKLGDYSVSCFLLGQSQKRSPAEIAEELAGKIKPTGLISRVLSAGPYLNFFVDQKIFSKMVLTEVAKAKDDYGSAKAGKGKKVMVEYFSPNTNKPLTIGHVRNICLGSSIVKLLKFTGHKVIASTLYNDRGIAIAKAILGYQKWGQGETPKAKAMKPDHFVGSFYVKFCQEAKKDPALEKEAQKVLQAWEEDKQSTGGGSAFGREVRAVWEKLMTWVFEGFKETLVKLGIEKFDEEYHESEYYQEGKQMVEKGLKKGIFVKDKAGVGLAPLAKHGLPDKIVLRPDETSLYVTQDLYLAYLKDKIRLDRSIYVVGSEQDLYFKQLFKILELFGFASARNYHHLSYGMIRLPSGSIKSREGLIKGTGADELLAELEEMARMEIEKRFSAKGGSSPKASAPWAHAPGGKDLPEKEINKRAKQIALAALKFYILAVSPQTTMVFDPQQSLAFTGRTGPYLQYVHARINSIFAKAKARPSARVDVSVLTNELELALVKLLAKFPEVIDKSVKNYDPSAVANYLYDLAKAFSLFYEKLPVIKAKDKVKKARLLLINDVKIVLKTGLDLLDIPAPEKM